jgi:hypothetical protein
MIQYGLISKIDSEVIEKTLSLIMTEFPNEEIHTCEIGIFNGQTSRGIRDFIAQHKREHAHVAIDNNKDFPVEKPYPECSLIIGNSMEVYNRIPDNYLHFCFVDGCHALPYVIGDYFCYCDKIKVGGYFLFHDTGRHIKPYKDWQRVGDKHDEDMHISCRRALEKIGMFKDAGYDLFIDGTVSQRYMGNHGFRLIFDEADEHDEAGGICCFKKIH